MSLCTRPVGGKREGPRVMQAKIRSFRTFANVNRRRAFRSPERGRNSRPPINTSASCTALETGRSPPAHAHTHTHTHTRTRAHEALQRRSGTEWTRGTTRLRRLFASSGRRNARTWQHRPRRSESGLDCPIRVGRSRVSPAADNGARADCATRFATPKISCVCCGGARHGTASVRVYCAIALRALWQLCGNLRAAGGARFSPAATYACPPDGIRDARMPRLMHFLPKFCKEKFPMEDVCYATMMCSR
ncbi:unnamed protein product, partial [Iphiclides podalirius]